MLGTPDESSVKERRRVPRGHAAWHIETITDLDTMRRNAWRWLELEHDCTDPESQFQNFEHCSRWAHAHCKPSDACDLYINLIYRGDTLVALLPLMIRAYAGFRVLTMMGGQDMRIANALVRSGHDYIDGLRLAIAQAEFMAGTDTVQLDRIPKFGVLADALSPDFLEPDPASLATWSDAAMDNDYAVPMSAVSPSLMRYRKPLTQTGKVWMKARSNKLTSMLLDTLRLFQR